MRFKQFYIKMQHSIIHYQSKGQSKILNHLPITSNSVIQIVSNKSYDRDRTLVVSPTWLKLIKTKQWRIDEKIIKRATILRDNGFQRSLKLDSMEITYQYKFRSNE